MEASQRKVVAIAIYLVAIILFVFFFAHPAWEWATWREAQGTLDLGFLKITTRPPFPNDPKGIGLGLLLPVALVAAARVLELGRKS